MPNHSGRSSHKQPPNKREPQKVAKNKSLEATCKDLKKAAAQDLFTKKAAASAEKYRAAEEELMAQTYGPNWKTQMPSWAKEESVQVDQQAYEPFQDNDDGEEPHAEVAVPQARKSGTQLRARKAG